MRLHTSIENFAISDQPVPMAALKADDGYQLLTGGLRLGTSTCDIWQRVDPSVMGWEYRVTAEDGVGAARVLNADKPLFQVPDTEKLMALLATGENYTDILFAVSLNGKKICRSHYPNRTLRDRAAEETAILRSHTSPRFDLINVYELPPSGGDLNSETVNLENWLQSGKNCTPALDATNQLIVAIVIGDAEKVKSALQAGANPNCQNRSNDFQPLHLAALTGYREIVGLLIAAGAQVNGVDHNLNSPLLYASSGGHLEVCADLVEAGANLQERNRDGKTPVKAAELSGETGVANLLRASLAKEAARQALQEIDPLPRGGESFKFTTIYNGVTSSDQPLAGDEPGQLSIILERDSPSSQKRLTGSSR